MRKRSVQKKKRKPNTSHRHFKLLAHKGFKDCVNMNVIQIAVPVFSWQQDVAYNILLLEYDDRVYKIYCNGHT